MMMILTLRSGLRTREALQTPVRRNVSGLARYEATSSFKGVCPTLPGKGGKSPIEG